MSVPTAGRDRAPRFPRAGLVLPAAVGAFLVAFLAGCQTFDSTVNAPAVMRAGPYVGVVGGGVIEQFDLPSGVDAETSWTGGLRGGWRFRRFAAVELSYEELFANELELDGLGTELGEVEGRTFVVQGKGYLVDAPLQGYLLAGIGVIDAEFEDSLGLGFAEDETDTVYKLGGGLEAHSGEHLTFFIESAWTKPDGDSSDFEYVTVLGGVNWRF